MLGVADENAEELLQGVRGSDCALVQKSGVRDSGGYEPFQTTRPRPDKK
ncbi:hypothetical protein [Porticoccus hydrocarbonoclasticus]